MLRRIIFAVVSLAVTVGVMGYLLGKHPPRKLLRIALDMDRRGLLCFVILSFSQVFFRTWRYQVLLRHVGVCVGNAAMLLTTLVRNLFSDLLPARIGSLSYIWVATQRLGVPLESATSSFAIAFIFDLIVIGPMVLLALAFAGGIADLPVRTIAVAGVVVLAIIAGLLAMLPRLLCYFGEVTGRFRGGKSASLGERISEAGRQVGSMKTGGIYWRVLLLSAFVRICKYGSLYFLVYAILKPYGYKFSELPISKVFLGMSAGELAASTPFSGVAGFGAYEGAWSGMFTALGFPRSLAEVTAVLNHAITQAWGYGLGMARYPSFADIDNDGHDEWTTGWGTLHNGHSVNGTDDGQHYLTVFDDDGTNLVSQPYPTHTDGAANHRFTDLDHDGVYEILAIESHGPTYYPGFPGWPSADARRRPF